MAFSSSGGNVASRIMARMAPPTERDWRDLLSSLPISVRDAVLQCIGLDEAPIGGGRGGEAAGHADPGVFQRADHLAERGVLAADTCHVATPKRGKWNHEVVVIAHAATLTLPQVSRDL